MPAIQTKVPIRKTRMFVRIALPWDFDPIPGDLDAQNLPGATGLATRPEGIVWLPEICRWLESKEGSLCSGAELAA